MSDQEKIIIDASQYRLIAQRLVYQIIERYNNLSDTLLIALQPRGVYFGRNICETLCSITGTTIPYGELDVTFYRDDFRRGNELLVPKTTKIPFDIEDKNIILIDDVFYTGRTVRAALDALLDFGRPQNVALMVLIQRKLMAQLPLIPNYTGKIVDTLPNQKVKVVWENEKAFKEVWLLNDHQ